MAGSGATLGYIKYVLGLDSLAFQEGLGDADKRLKAAQKALGKTADKFKTIGSVMSVGITAPFLAIASSSIPAAEESMQAMGQVQSALTSMGDAAQRTLPQLQAQASALMHLSTFDDDDILRKVTANMLTFGNVSGEAFDRAQLAAVNLSARLGQDLQSSAIQVGKALNDPVKGITALSRVGVSFTAQQVAQIKAMSAAGDAAGAQGIILGELERQFGGAAKAMRDATPGIESQQAWADFQETVGSVAIKVLPPLTNAATALLNAFNHLSPSTQAVVLGVAAVAAGLGPVIIGVGGVISVVATVLPALTALIAGFSGLAVAEGVAATASYALGVALNVALPWLAAIAGAVALAYAAYQHWDDIKAIVGRVVGYMGALYTGVKTWIVDKLASVWKAVTDKITMVKDAFYSMYDAVVGHSYVPDMVEGIAFEMARLDGVMVSPVMAATAKATDAFKRMRDSVAGIIDRLFPDQAKVRGLAQDLADLDAALAAKLIDRDVWRAARIRLSDELKAMGDTARQNNADTMFGNTDLPALDMQKVSDELAQSIPKVWDTVTAANDNAARNFEQTVRSIAGSFEGLVNDIRRGDWVSSLSGVLDLFLQLGSTGLFGKNLAASINAPRFGGARADGGAISDGKSYLVGERGPELFTASRSGYITANENMQGGASRVQIVPSPYFDVVVDGRVGRGVSAAAPSLMSGGGDMAIVRQQRMSGRRLA